MRIHGALVGVLAVLAAACGARGDPMAPLRTVPPPLPNPEISQLGTRALVRFTPIADTVDMGNDQEMTIDRMELLMLTERYPALTASMLAQGLDRERGERLELARRAVEMATESAEARRVAEERLAAEEAAAAAGVVLPPVEEASPDDASTDDELADGQEPVTEEQRLLDGLPRDALREWREAGVEGRIILEAARWFEESVDELWDLLGMPTAIVDTRRPPELPLPSLVVEKAAQLARTHPYEGDLPVAEFLARAAIVAAVPFEDINDYVVSGRARIDHNIGTSSSGPVRTRYYFAVRVVDTEDKAGRIDTLLPLAPGSVPLAPAELEIEVTPYGASLEWAAPAGDVWGELIDADEISYNIYRRLVDAESAAVTPINYAPIESTEYLDSSMTWGDRYVYEVRAIAAPPSTEDSLLLVEPEPPQGVALDPANPTVLTVPIEAAGPTKEGSGALTPPVHVVDTFEPEKLLELEAVRAATRITLRWAASTVPDLVGYRVYRRTLVDDPCDPRYMLEHDEEEDEEEDADDDADDESGCADDAETEPEVADAEATRVDGDASDPALLAEAGSVANGIADDATAVDDAADDIVVVDRSADDGQSSQGLSPDNEPVAQDGEPDDLRQADREGEPDDESEAQVDDEGEALVADEVGEDDPGEGGRRRRRRNELVNSGWDMLTAVVISELRYTDPTTADDQAWEYAIEAVDDAGNVSPPAVVKIRVGNAAEEQ